MKNQVAGYCIEDSWELQAVVIGKQKFLLRML